MSESTNQAHQRLGVVPLTVREWRARCSHLDGHRLHHDGSPGVVVAGRNLGDGLADVVALGDLAEDGVLGLARREPIQVSVVRHVHEELGAPGVRRATICHGQGAGRVRVPGDALVLDVAAAEARLHRARLEVFELAIRRAAGARLPAVGVLGVGAAELVHEARDHAVEVHAVVEAGLSQVDEVGRGQGHAVQVDLGFNVAHGRLEHNNGVRHAFRREGPPKKHGRRARCSRRVPREKAGP
mmetsp:Transcript_25554/g.65153  ORF Transcript_25554/g.65153 Transcript_25554/m.65153 type:complete len:241 (-) Transcript_25554:18-740(-)